MLQIVLLVSLESSPLGGGMHAWALLPWLFGLCGAKVLDYWMISSLDLRCKSSWLLNDFFNWKFRRNWNVPLVLLERTWWAGFNGIYLVRKNQSRTGGNTSANGKGHTWVGGPILVHQLISVSWIEEPIFWVFRSKFTVVVKYNLLINKWRMKI
jgi:hypothetical protein